jgi:hypothetical protein
LPHWPPRPWSVPLSIKAQLCMKIPIHRAGVDG